MYQLRPKALVKKADPVLLGKAGGFALAFAGNGLDDMAVIQNGLLFIDGWHGAVFAANNFPYRGYLPFLKYNYEDLRLLPGF